MDAQGVVDTDRLGRFVAHAARAGISSVGVLGSTGSYMYLTAEERARALEAAVEAAGATPVLAGIGALSTREVLANARAAEKAGAAALLLAPVSYLPLTNADVTALVTDVAAATDLPICLYNNPATTHFTISDVLVAQLAEIPSVAAVKHPAPAGGAPEAARQLAWLRRQTPGGFVLGYSGDALIHGPLSADADAWYSVLAGTRPELALSIWEARGDAARVDAAHSACAPLWALFNAHGAIRVVPHIAEITGLGSAPLPRPLLPLPGSVITQIEAALDALPYASQPTQ